MADVDLPEFTCKCPYKNLRSHLTSCTEAQAYTDNLVMQPGLSYAAINWKYPLELSFDATAKIEVDPVAYIRERLDHYRSWQDPVGSGAEKPVAYLWWLAEEHLDFYMPGCGRRVMEAAIEVTDWDYHHSWTRDSTLRLHQQLGIADADGNDCEPPTDAEAIAAVDQQLFFGHTVQPTKAAALLDKLRSEGKTDDDLCVLVHEAATAAAHAANDAGIEAQINFLLTHQN